MPLTPETPAYLVPYVAPANEESSKAKAFLEALAAFEITTQDQRAACAAALADAQANWKRFDAQEKTLTKPKLSEVESAREIFRSPKAAFRVLEDLLKSKLKDYEVRTALQISDATEFAAMLSASGDTSGAHAALTAAGEPSGPAPPGMQIRHPWQFDVINVEMLPRDYLLPNLKAITAYMRAELTKDPENAPVLPGVKFHRGLEIAGSSKR